MKDRETKVLESFKRRRQTPPTVLRVLTPHWRVYLGRLVLLVVMVFILRGTQAFPWIYALVGLEVGSYMRDFFWARTFVMNWSTFEKYLDWEKISNKAIEGTGE